MTRRPSSEAIERWRSNLEAMTYEQLIDIGRMHADQYGNALVSSDPHWQAELATRPAPEDVWIVTSADVGAPPNDFCVWDDNLWRGDPDVLQQYHQAALRDDPCIANFPWWTQHTQPGMTPDTALRACERALRDHQQTLESL